MTPPPAPLPTRHDKHARPLKKRALSPTSTQAQHLETLFSRPDQQIRTSKQTSASGPQPPDIVTNVQGSSAGAGSGEFHVYKAARRRERERLRRLDEEVKAEREQDEFERNKKEREERDAEKTRRRREKRRKKAGTRGGGVTKGQGGGNGGAEDDNGGNGKGKVMNGLERRREESMDVDGDGEDGAQTGADGVERKAVSTEEVGLVIHEDD